MTLEKFFVDGDVLDRHEPVARLVVSHRVDQEGRIAIVNAVEQRWEIKRHGIETRYARLIDSVSSRFLLRWRRGRLRGRGRGSGFGRRSRSRGLGSRAAAGRIELLDDFGGDVERRIRPHQSTVDDAEQEVE